MRRSANTLPPNLAFEKLFSKQKKSFKLILRENSDYRRDDDIYFQKKFKQLLSEKCRKIFINRISLQKRNIYSDFSQTVRRGRFERVLWCAASLFKVLCTDTNFLPKMRKCCHEIIFHWRSAPFWATSPISGDHCPKKC